MKQKEKKNDLYILGSYNFNINNASKEWLEMSNEVLVIIIGIVVMVPAILFYELIIVRNYADKFLPPTVLSLFSNGNPRNLDKKNEKDKT